MTDASFRFTHAVTRRPAASITRGLRAIDIGTPDLATMQGHHAAYIAALRATGATVVELPPLDAFPDSVFVEDTALCLPQGAIIMRPGAPTRLGEAAEMAPHLQALYTTVAFITGPGTIEGGDILVTGREILVGRSARTDAAGIEELRALVTPWGHTLREVHCAKYEIVNLSHVAKTNFQFLRMRVDVDGLGIELEVEQVCRLATVIEHIPVTQPHRPCEQPIAHRSAVDVEILVLAGRACRLRLSDPAPETHGARLTLDGERTAHELGPHDRGNPRPLRIRRRSRRCVEQRARAVAQAKSDIEARQREALDDAHDVRQLGAFRAQELAPGRNVVEQVPDLDSGAARLR